MSGVNVTHTELRWLAEQDPSLGKAIEFIEVNIKLRGYQAVKADAGVRAWFDEHNTELQRIANMRRGTH